MPSETIRFDDCSDARLAPYKNLRERTLRGQSLFIAEGSLVVERMLTSPYHVESICATQTAWERCTFRDRIAHDTSVYLVKEKAIMDEIVGFDFHQGMMAIGRRQKLPECCDGVRKIAQTRSSAAWIVLPRATKPDNLGLAFRSAAALGAAGVLLGEQCCDPFSRRSLRVSMGGVLQVPVFKANDLENELRELRKWVDAKIYAAVLNENARHLDSVTQWPGHSFFLFGNEYDGLTPNEIAWADEMLVIPMRPDVDSLNLGVSIGVFLYEYNRSCAISS